jgi:hypothetical protein
MLKETAREARYTVLIIDDCDRDRQQYSRFLQQDQQRCYGTIEAGFNHPFLPLWQQAQPDVILLGVVPADWTNVLEILSYLRLQSRQTPIPVILLSDHEDEVLIFEAKKRGAYDCLGKATLSAASLKRAIGSAIEASGLLRQLEQSREEQRSIWETTLRMHRSLNLQEVLQTVAAEVQQSLSADRALVCQFSGDANGTIVAEALSPSWKSMLNLRIHYPSFCDQVSSGHKSAIADIYQAGLSQAQVQLLEQFQVRASLSVPIVLDSPHVQVWGALIVHHCSAERLWQAAEQERLERLVEQMTIAIQQAIAFEQLQAALQEQQKTEAALAQLSASVAAAPIGIFRTNAKGYCLYVNERYCEMTGVDALEALGLGWSQTLHPDDRNRFFATWYEATHKQLSFQADYRFTRLDGSVIWVAGQAVVERNPQGNVTGYIGTISDITNFKNAEQALQQLNLELDHQIEQQTAELIQANHQLIKILTEQQKRETALNLEMARLNRMNHLVVVMNRAATKRAIHNLRTKERSTKRLEQPV